MARFAGHSFICIPLKTISLCGCKRRHEQQGADWPNHPNARAATLTK